MFSQKKKMTTAAKSAPMIEGLESRQLFAVTTAEAKPKPPPKAPPTPPITITLSDVLVSSYQ